MSSSVARSLKRERVNWAVESALGKWILDSILVLHKDNTAQGAAGLPFLSVHMAVALTFSPCKGWLLLLPKAFPDLLDSVFLLAPILALVVQIPPSLPASQIQLATVWLSPNSDLGSVAPDFSVSIFLKPPLPGVGNMPYLGL